MTRPPFLERHPSVALAVVLLGWLAVGILEGLGY